MPGSCRPYLKNIPNKISERVLFNEACTSLTSHINTKDKERNTVISDFIIIIVIVMFKAATSYTVVYRQLCLD